jgi:hypothetical protein
MWPARKAHDLQHNPHFALHSGSEQPDTWTGDTKLAGLAEEISDPERVGEINDPKSPPGPWHQFRLACASSPPSGSTTPARGS